MSYTIIQNPATMSLAQSPVIFSVSSSVNVGQPNFQYIAELSIWSGSLADSASGDLWTLAKYPSSQGLTGIFDVSRILNSTMTELTQTNVSAVKYFKINSYPRYQSGSSYVTGSGVTSLIYQAVDGYQIFPEPIGEEIYNITPHWPIMSDAPATQSIFLDNKGRQAIYVANLGVPQPTSIKYVGDNGNSGSFAVSSSSSNSNYLITTFPIGPAETDFPIGSVDLTSFTIQPLTGSVEIGTPIRFTIGCQQKYPNIRIKWKNRFGEFDYLNFDMINRKSISSDKRTYQPQLGSWQGRTLSYNEYDTQTLNYIVDSKQNIICNTNWLDEAWNETLKQLLVSTEIYWCLENTDEVKPLTIVTSNIQFKTGVNDHLIQYQFEFAYGQNYKLIL